MKKKDRKIETRIDRHKEIEELNHIVDDINVWDGMKFDDWVVKAEKEIDESYSKKIRKSKRS